MLYIVIIVFYLKVKWIINGNKQELMIIKERFEGPVGDYSIARNPIKCLFHYIFYYKNSYLLSFQNWDHTILFKAVKRQGYAGNVFLHQCVLFYFIYQNKLKISNDDNKKDISCLIYWETTFVNLALRLNVRNGYKWLIVQSLFLKLWFSLTIVII